MRVELKGTCGASRRQICHGNSWGGMISRRRINTFPNYGCALKRNCYGRGGRCGDWVGLSCHSGNRGAGNGRGLRKLRSLEVKPGSSSCGVLDDNLNNLKNLKGTGPSMRKEAWNLKTLGKRKNWPQERICL